MSARQRFLISLGTVLMLLCSIPATAQRGQIAKLRQQSAALEKQLQETERLVRTNRRDVASQVNNLNILNEQ
ncbi:MAG: peptidase M23, partial [Alloprevotella sp.]|nr:peptidase M23 [Alloprevotella sp.]